MEVQLTILYTSDYCGGAYPSDEILAAMKQERTLDNTEMVLKAVETGNMERVTTGMKGQANIALTPGRYEVYFPVKISAEAAAAAISPEQCAKWKKTPDAVFEIAKDTELANILLKVHRTCNPCEPPRP